MHRVGRYTLASGPAAGVSPATMVTEIATAISDWIDSKGEVVCDGPPITIRYMDGRECKLSVSKISSKDAALMSWRMDEPLDAGVFRTSMELAYDDARLGLDISLEAGYEGLTTPVFVDARCPGIVQDVLKIPWPWEIGGWQLPTGGRELVGDESGEAFLELLRDDQRSVPLIAISGADHWSDRFVEALTSDLARIATVRELDAGASWELSRRLGRRWSCFNGALRIYWPRWTVEQDSHRHPLWTQERISGLGSDFGQACRSLRGQIRGRILHLSTMGMQRDDVFRRAIEAYRDERRSDRELLDLVLEENSDLVKQNDSLKEDNSRLRTELENMRVTREWEALNDGMDVAPDKSWMPRSVVQAVARARTKFGKRLKFGDDVDAGVAELAPDAGPPHKVYNYLEGLSELAEVASDGSIGSGVNNWLNERGFTTSRESDTTRNAGLRSWRVDGHSQEFDHHMKPSDSTSPDKCVRIYFKPLGERILVGWVGRHPD